MPFVRTPGGLRLFYQEQGRGNRCVLLVHGNLASSRWWERVMVHLPDDLHVVAPDLRGCGQSDKPSDLWSMSDLAGDLFHLIERLGLACPAVVGHSLGGGVAMQLMAEYPERVDRALLVNSAPADGLQLPEERYGQIQVWATMPDVIRGALKAMMPTAPDDGYRATLLDDSLNHSVGAWLPNGRALQRMNVADRLAALSIPTLVLYGGLDPLVTREMAERTRSQIPGAQLEVWPEVGHSAPVEAPERLARRILEFMA